MQMYNQFMLIGIDCRYLLEKRPAGPEKYLYFLIKNLALIDTSNEYILYFKEEPSDIFFWDLTNGNPNFYYQIVSSSILWTQAGLFKELRKNPVDVFFSSSHTLPFLAVKGPFKARNTSWVSMIHGLDYIHGYKNLLTASRVKIPMILSVRTADHVITPSPHTKTALVSNGWVDSSKVTVIPEGVSLLFSSNIKKDRSVLEKYGLEDKPYFIFVSTIQPRKNIPGLVAGFAGALRKGKIPPETQLVVCGKKGWQYDESLETPKEHGVEKNVIFAGRVSDKELPALMHFSVGFVSTSFEEGFGLTLLEAMISEVPCIISNIPSYRSILRGYDNFGSDISEPSSDLSSDDLPAFLVDPMDQESISQGIAEAFSNYPQEYITKAKEIGLGFSWENTARNTLAIFEKLE